MLPLGVWYELEQVIYRVEKASEVDKIVVATSDHVSNDIVEWCTRRAGASVFRGQEHNVLDRTFMAAKGADADVIVRITADCPLVHPQVIDMVIKRWQESGADYCSNTIERTFPRGLDVEVFSFESFDFVHRRATESEQLEHVTKYYHDHPEEFSFTNVASEEVFEDTNLCGRTDLRLTLDEFPDYLLLRKVFDRLNYKNTPQFSEVVNFIDQYGLAKINNSVDQKEPRNGNCNKG